MDLTRKKTLLTIQATMGCSGTIAASAVVVMFLHQVR